MEIESATDPAPTRNDLCGMLSASVSTGTCIAMIPYLCLIIVTTFDQNTRM